MKIGILTYHRSHNYGAFMQAYALCETLNLNGHDTEIIDYNMPQASDMYKVRGKIIKKRYYETKQFRMFKNNLSNARLSSTSLISSDIDAFQDYVNGKYDIIISGSDEVWKLDGVRGFPNPYWLPGDLGCIKMAYAVSSRSDIVNLNSTQIHQAYELINDFSFISGRDNYTLNNIAELSNNEINAHRVCDPTFLYDFKSDSDHGQFLLKKKCNITSPQKKIGVMLLDKNLATNIYNRYSDNYELVSLATYLPKYKNIMYIDPFEWAHIISSLDLLITNFFHGMCFALQNNTPFIAVESLYTEKKKSKMYDLLEYENLLADFVHITNADYSRDVINLCDKKLAYENNVDYKKNIYNQRQLSHSFFDYIKNI